MPTYTFIDEDTNEEFDLQLKIAEKEDFLKANKNLKQVIGAPNIVSGVDGLRRPDEGFNEVLQNSGVRAEAKTQIELFDFLRQLYKI